MLRFLWIIFLYLPTAALFAQSGSVYVIGVVVNQEAQPIPSATITGSSVGAPKDVQTSTDHRGRFTLHCPSVGPYQFTVRSVGYQVYRTDFNLTAAADLDTITLVPIARALEEVEVKGKPRVLEINGGTITYNVDRTIGGQDVSALEALKKAPGVHVENETNITLNGKSGVQILLDGKQTYLSGKELTDLLKSISSNTIKSIEVINSPTARFEATGAAGIINIITKRNQIKGVSGSMTTGLAYGVSAKQMQQMSISYRRDRWNIYGNYNHTLGNYNYEYGTNRKQNGRSYDSHTDDIDKRQKMSGQVGADYAIDAKNTIGFLANGNFIFGGGITDTKTDISILPSSEVDHSLDAINDYYGQGTSRYNFNLNYKYEDTLGHVLNIDADYGLFDKWNKNLQSNTYRDRHGAVMSDSLYRTLNGIDIDLKGAKIDYSANLWGGKFETGAKYSAISSANDSRFYHVIRQTDSLDNRRTNDFHYDERIFGAYVDYRRTLHKWSFQTGLRMELSNSTGRLLFMERNQKQDSEIKRNFRNLFPFFSVSLKPSTDHNISLSYAKRIERPAYQDLNPFVYLLDELSFWQGNPFLNPELTQRFTLLYSRKSTTVISLSYAYTDQFNARVTDTVDTEKIVMINKNIGTQKHWSLSLTQNLRPVTWWDITFNGLAYHIHNNVSFDQYRNLNLKQLAGRVNLQQTFQLPSKFRAELTAVYNTRRLSGANTFSRAYGQVDIAIQKSLLQDRASLRLAVSDIYKGNISRYTQDFPGFESQSYGYYESRQARLSFTYRFTKGASKDQRARKSALESESGRIK
ncbi:TonB-dependent receptor [Sphingobacterium tabacisoli]|uniref:Outer membrane beta-barrel protein n=1 Tax=Sphingobacterium tabacisoli TaxID=2044855 RepID=A0ABW5L6H9_9SPHI|nr:TonB-dependent receptor [Sphingobacterium tabacisoli]